MSCSVAVPYVPASRLPNMFRLIPCRHSTFVRCCGGGGAGSHTAAVRAAPRPNVVTPAPAASRRGRAASQRAAPPRPRRKRVAISVRVRVCRKVSLRKYVTPSASPLATSTGMWMSSAGNEKSKHIAPDEHAPEGRFVTPNP